MDEAFIGRIYRTSAWVTLLVVLYLLALSRFQWAWSVGAGAALSLLVIRAFQWAVYTATAPGLPPRRRFLLAFAVLKLPALALIIYGVVRSGWFHLAAFAIGVALVHTVIFLKAVGMFLMQREEDRRQETGARRTSGGGMGNS